MHLTHTALALAAAAALVAGTAAPATAIPNPTGANDDLFSIHLVVPDPDNAPALCAITYTPTSRVTFTSTGFAVGTANESGRMKVTSSGCASVAWTTVVIVSDESPTHPPRTVVGTGGAAAAAGQGVPYALGVREAGIVTVTMLASSRLGSFCWEDRYQVTALGNPTPIDSNPC